MKFKPTSFGYPQCSMKVGALSVTTVDYSTHPRALSRYVTLVRYPTGRTVSRSFDKLTDVGNYIDDLKYAAKPKPRAKLRDFAEATHED